MTVGARPKDATCRLLMTAPGVGVLTALTFKSAVDDPGRFRSSKIVGRISGARRRNISRVKRTSPAPLPGQAMGWCVQHALRGGDGAPDPDESLLELEDLGAGSGASTRSPSRRSWPSFCIGCGSRIRPFASEERRRPMRRLDDGSKITSSAGPAGPALRGPVAGTRTPMTPTLWLCGRESGEKHVRQIGARVPSGRHQVAAQRRPRTEA